VALLMLPLLGARHAVNVSGQLERAERERRVHADRLIDERELERARIASDVHDLVLQQLAALQIESDSIRAAIENDQPDVAVRVAAQLRSGVDGAIGELRATIASLRRTTIDDGGLGASLQRFARAFRVSSGIDVDVIVPDDLSRLPLPVALLVFECCQEALTNAARHARADRIVVTAGLDGDTAHLTVEDDGVGFDPAAVSRGAGLGLSREKVELAGGLVFVRTQPGVGTTVTVRVPLGAPT
jgi:signal transduction histidine kinase